MTVTTPTAKFIINETDGSHSLNVLVDGMHCPSCVVIIENALKKQDEISNARLNLSTKRLKISWRGAVNLGDKWVQLINNMGYRAVPFDTETSETFEKQEEKFLLRCLAVAGFATGNLMLFSVPLWSSTGVEMGELTRNMFHWLQVLIALPAIIYCGLPFYRSAFLAIKDGHTNMDVPISVAVILSTSMSMLEIINKGQHAYLDSGVMLLFFLLIGRYLDARARGKARSAAHDLLQMMTGFVTIIKEGGDQEIIAISQIKEGMILVVAAGEKIGADGKIISGESELDSSLITGETMPQKIIAGDKVFAGTINISAPVKILVTKAGEKSLLAEIIRLMENAEQSQARYVTIADKISGWYTPVVHVLAAGTFLGWWLFAGEPWQVALLTAATVLIITCPCALGLAVPVVQVLSSGRLMRQGILIKSGSALERLAKVTHVIFDKTGTLTLGKPQLLNVESYSDKQLKMAASLAVYSKHPLSVAISNAYKKPLHSMNVKEISGCGLEAHYENKLLRLGKRDWCGVYDLNSDNSMELWLSVEDEQALRFVFADKIRKDAKNTIRSLHDAGFITQLLSGDRAEVVQSTASEVGIKDAFSKLSPVEKCNKIDTLKAMGANVLMVGDGLNDAPSLATATVSMSPSSAMDITQTAADIVFQGENLNPVLVALNTAKFAQILVKQNFALAILYNIIAVPLAILGYVTPLVAAIAMSSSSILVIANAMRLNIKKRI